MLLHACSAEIDYMPTAKQAHLMDTYVIPFHTLSLKYCANYIAASVIEQGTGSVTQNQTHHQTTTQCHRVPESKNLCQAYE